jgi:hypothetical protein
METTSFACRALAERSEADEVGEERGDLPFTSAQLTEGRLPVKLVRELRAEVPMEQAIDPSELLGRAMKQGDLLTGEAFVPQVLRRGIKLVALPHRVGEPA